MLQAEVHVSGVPLRGSAGCCEAGEQLKYPPPSLCPQARAMEDARSEAERHLAAVIADKDAQVRAALAIAAAADTRAAEHSHLASAPFAASTDAVRITGTRPCSSWAASMFCLLSGPPAFPCSSSYRKAARQEVAPSGAPSRTRLSAPYHPYPFRLQATPVCLQSFSLPP